MIADLSLADLIPPTGPMSAKDLIEKRIILVKCADCFPIKPIQIQTPVSHWPYAEVGVFREFRSGVIGIPKEFQETGNSRNSGKRNFTHCVPPTLGDVAFCSASIGRVVRAWPVARPAGAPGSGAGR